MSDRPFFNFVCADMETWANVTGMLGEKNRFWSPSRLDEGLQTRYGMPVYLIALEFDMHVYPPGSAAVKVTDLTETDPRISPCPFCGSDKVLNWLSHDAAPDMWCVFCDSCGAEGPHAPGDKDKSIDLWNKRGPVTSKEEK